MAKGQKLSGIIFFCLFRATPTAYGGSQARIQIGAVGTATATHQIQAASATYTTAQGNARSLSP